MTIGVIYSQSKPHQPRTSSLPVRPVVTIALRLPCPASEPRLFSGVVFSSGDVRFLRECRVFAICRFSDDVCLVSDGVVAVVAPAPELRPEFLSLPGVFSVREGDAVVLPCSVRHVGECRGGEGRARRRARLRRRRADREGVAADGDVVCATYER